jgi:hypothetical protein
MKRVLLTTGAILVAGSVGFSQTPPTRTIAYSPNTEITARELHYDDSQKTTFARGGVRVVSESSTITADEADVHLVRSQRDAVDLDIVLRGNVRVLVSPSSRTHR